MCTRIVRSLAVLGMASFTLPCGRAQDVLWTFDGEQERGVFAHSVAGPGDLDGDGHADLIVGSLWGYPNSNGRVYVYSGRTGQTIFVYTGGPSDGLARSMALGDLDQDGVNEFVLGAIYSDYQGWDQAGQAHVYSGRTGLNLYSFGGEGRENAFGASLANAGDIDADGVPDILIGAPSYASFSPVFDIGKVYVYSGTSGALLRTGMGENEYDSFGKKCVGNEDLDGDGVADQVFYADLGSGSDGKVYAFSGEDGHLLFSRTGGYSHALGYGLALISDLSGDGVADLLAAAPSGPGDWRTSPGCVYLYSGRDGALLDSFVGEAALDQLGYVVSRLGDVNGDGVEDFAAAAPTHDGGYTDRGAVYLYSGRTRKLLYRFVGVDESSVAWLGVALSFAGDVNADGLSDLIAGATGYQLNRGRALVFAGNDLFLQAEPSSVKEGGLLLLSTRGGASGGMVLLALTAVNGAPLFVPFFLGALDGYGDHTLAATLPQGLAGLKLSVTAFATRHSGGVADSSPATFTITSQ